ncbi:MAG: amidohydrolase [Candidatus Eisenbacteria bacterium]|uniref:Amidohydrolase n=1 Tax=Eiseniibacteriota bacterium TaxID=2212470 RepID=A0A849SB79_UNCEI|nr:amidohydrolase [Candidatus Eisenbacteria bacterium]
MTAAREQFTGTDLDEMIAVRRDLHAHPETAFEEVRTSGIVAERLRSLGLEARTGIGRTGVMATVKGGRPGKTVLLRADMDALPIHEENAVPYRSQVHGKMHACGHDCHTSILLAISKKLVADQASLSGTVSLCFQPAEEQGGGADAMIADGAIEQPRPDAAFGLHVWQDLDLGKIGVTTGAFMAAVDEFTVTVKGVGGHAAMPHASVDPVLCLAHIVTALQSIASRSVDPLLEVVVSVTQFHAGAAFNVIPETAMINGTVRTFDEGVWALVPGRFEAIVQGVASAFGCTAETRFERFHKVTRNDPAMATIAREVAIEMVGAENVVTDLRTMGGEDFSAFLQRVPGCFIAVGSRNERRGLVYGHHHPRFDVDEASMKFGAEILLRTAQRFLAS